MLRTASQDLVTPPVAAMAYREGAPAAVAAHLAALEAPPLCLELFPGEGCNLCWYRFLRAEDQHFQLREGPPEVVDLVYQEGVEGDLREAGRYVAQSVHHCSAGPHTRRSSLT